MRWTSLGLAIAVVSVSGTAMAVKVNEPLYIKTKDAKVLKTAKLTAPTLTVLQPGTEVIWLGPDKANKKLHRIRTAKGEGFILQQNLTPKKPAAEHLAKDDGKPIDPQAFASSGAATKALSEAALKYASKKSKTELARGVMTAEGIAATVDRKAAQDFNDRQTGGGK
jgi:hypothetical protein